MKISTRGHYAVQALVDIASQPDKSPVSLSVIAARQELSQNYLEQLFVKLRKKGLVRSIRGPGGGYLLARLATEISIGDVFEAVDESLVITECATYADSVKHPCSKASDCRTQSLWAKLCNHFNDLLFSISIDDVVNGNIDILRGALQASVNNAV